MQLNKKNIGDWQQILELRRIYNNLLKQKEAFIENALHTGLSPEQLAAVDLQLSIITGKLKETDAHIHYLMFGGEMKSKEVPAMGLMDSFERSKQLEESELMKTLRKENQELLSENQFLKFSRNNYRYKARLLSGMDV